MQKWEYRVVGWDQIYATESDTIQEYINGLGENGWELISVTAFSDISGTVRTQGQIISGSTSTRIYTKLFFKRPKP